MMLWVLVIIPIPAFRGRAHLPPQAATTIRCEN